MSLALPKRLPTPLSERLSDASSALYSRQGREFDVAIGGIPFMLATFNELPQSLETIEVRKDQFDTEDPGEQSLSGWWRRSQASWHEGAGNLYQEAADRVDSFSFYDSNGIDVFTPGQLKLYRRMAASTITGTAYSRVRVYNEYPVTTQGFTAVANGALHVSTTASGSFGELHAPASKTIVDGLIAADYFYDVASDGTLYEGLRSSPGTATTWPLNDTPKRMSWGMHRLWVIGERKIWQPDVDTPGSTAQDPIYTHPNKGWHYTCLAEGPAAMYFGGHDGNKSAIQMVTLDASGGIPTLTGATVAATLPQGELVQEIAILAGQYIGIGTNRGLRVGVIAENNSITYGPLIIDKMDVTCTALESEDRFLLIGFDDETCVYRVDTGTPLDGGVFPYARAEAIPVGGVHVTSIAAGGSDLVVTGSNDLVYYRHATEYIPTGSLTTGRIRFRTTELKAFRYLNLDIDPLEGQIAVSIVRDDGSALAIGSVTAQGGLFTDALKYEGGPMRHAAVKFTLTPTGDSMGSPLLRSYLLRALPAVAPQRLITLPLLCYDVEQSRSGQRYGGNGFAHDRLTALMTLEDAAEELVYQDFSEVGTSRVVVIDSLRFAQTSPSTASGPGGILLVKLRTVDL